MEDIPGQLKSYLMPYKLGIVYRKWILKLLHMSKWDKEKSKCNILVLFLQYNFCIEYDTLFLEIKSDEAKWKPINQGREI